MDDATTRGAFQGGTTHRLCLRVPGLASKIGQPSGRKEVGV
jgi:hypothetical protein